MNHYKLPSPTGRMSHNEPEIQMLPSPPGLSRWQQELANIRKLSARAQSTGEVFMTSQQPPLQSGDLVLWSPTGKPGLWRVTDIRYKGRYDDYESMEIDYSAIEHRVAGYRYADDATPVAQNPCNETALSESAKTVLKEKYIPQRRRSPVESGMVRLEWFAGWGGYANDRRPVSVKIEEVTLANEMEAIALAASDHHP